MLRSTRLSTLLLAVILSSVVLASPVLAVELTPRAVDRFFVAPDKAAVLAWRVASEAPQGPVAYTIRDYWGRQVNTGQARLVGDDSLEATVKLARGYYDLEIPAAGQRFGIVVLPAAEAAPDPFFAIDTAMSWLVRDDAVRLGLVKALRRSGIAMARERLTWGGIHPTRDRWDWETSRRFETLRRAYAAERVDVLEMFHDTPAWMGRVGKYPADLVAASRSWQTIAPRWQSSWGALEVWNEPDIFFGGNLPADQYAALVKTVAWALDRSRFNRPVVGGVVAHCNRRFLDSAARNGMLESVDIVSFHTYDRAPKMEGLVAEYRQWLKAHGHESMPLWITECGRPWRRGVNRPPTEEDAESALDVTMKAVEARALGIARHFPFVYPFYEERKNNFGMMGRRATPLRSMAAYARLATLLAGCRYLGDLACDDKAVRRARVFGDDRQTVAIVYTELADGRGSVKLGLPHLRLEGIDGRPLKPTADGAVPVPDGLVYVWLDRRKLGDRLQTDTAAMRLQNVARGELPRRPAPVPIVMRLQQDPKQLAATSEGYRVLADPPEKLSLTVRVFNLSDRVHKLVLRPAFSQPSARAVEPTERRVAVAAEGFADVSWQIDLRGAFAATGQLGITVTAVGDTAGRVLPLAVDLTGQASVAEVLKRYPRHQRLPIHRSESWKPSIAAGGRMTVDAAPEGHWRLKAHFAPGDRWVYPRFALPEGTDLGRSSGLVLRARCRRPAVVRVFLFEGDGVGYLTEKAIVPADDRWHTAVVRFADLAHCSATKADPDGRLDRAAVRHISIGLNSETDENTLEVSEAYLVGSD